MDCCKNSFILCNPIPDCTDILSIKTAVISDDIFIVFHDKFNKNYSVSVTTDENGIAEIILISYDGIVEVDLPEALLNQFAGPFRFSVYDLDKELVQYTINGLQYDAIGIDIESFTPLSEDRPITFSLDPFTMEGIQGSY